MSSRQPSDTIITRSRYDAIIFDLDGVITKTAKVHAAAWKTMFDQYLEERAGGGDYKPFDIEVDYPAYVDGKPRYQGVKSFLDSRGIDLPYGSTDDPPDSVTVCGLGNRKNRLFTDHLREERVEVYPSSIDLLENLKHRGFKVAVATSSKNRKEVLDAAGASDLFEAEVDGIDIDWRPPGDWASTPASASSSRTPSPESRPAAGGTSAWSSGSTERTRERHSRRRGPTSWWMTSRRSTWRSRLTISGTPSRLWTRSKTG
jgi:beta-phosphoglucomutase-like phosphatase (HAD superfamily)